MSHKTYTHIKSGVTLRKHRDGYARVSNCFYGTWTTTMYRNCELDDTRKFTRNERPAKKIRNPAS